MVYKVSLTSGVFRRVTGNSPFQGQWAFDDFSRLAALTSTTALVGWAQGTADVRQSSSDGAPIAGRYLAVTGDYFTVLGMRASAGRLLFPADDAPGAANVVVSEGFWKNRLGANPSIVGRPIWLDDRAYTVVGIVDRKHTMPSPAQPNDLRRQMEKPRVLAVLSLSVGALAMGLAVIGLFGVTAFIVEQRTHELSVRRALGASRADLTTMLLRDSLRPVIAGLACGLFIALAGARGVQSLLSDVSARDPVAVVAAVLVLMAASSAAVLLPARRAARLNPAQVLKLG